MVLALVLTLLSCGAAVKDNDDLELPADGYRYTKYIDVQNNLMRNYLEEYENFQKTQNEDDKEVMETVKLLIVQCWIYALSPAKNLLKSFISIEEKNSLEEIWLSLRQSVKAKTEAVVADEFLAFEGAIAKTFRGTLEKRAETLGSKVEKLEAEIAKENNDLKKEELVTLRLKYIDQQNQVELLKNIHDAALKMVLQSYIKDFGKDPKGLKTFEMVPSDSSKKRVFKVPTLKKGNVEGFFSDDSDEEENETASKKEE